MTADASTEARMAAAEMAERILSRQPNETPDEQTARIMALPPQLRADAIVALHDRAFVFLLLAARYREPIS